MSDPTSTTPYSVGSIDKHVEEYVSIAGESLMSSDRSQWQVYLDRIGLENMRGVFARATDRSPDEPRLIGGMGIYTNMKQWFGGKPIDCAGISGVAISPAHRGTGACRCMLQQTLRELKDSGTPLASLYASTVRPYRAVGFQQAGVRTMYSIDIAKLANIKSDLPVHRCVNPDIGALEKIAQRRSQSTNGHLQRSNALWQRIIHPYGPRKTTTYLFGDAADPEGYLILREGSYEPGSGHSLQSRDMVANTPEALRRIASVIYHHAAVYDRFNWYGDANDPLELLASEQSVKLEYQIRWLVRVLDVPMALTARGYPADVHEESAHRNHR